MAVAMKVNVSRPQVAKHRAVVVAKAAGAAAREAPDMAKRQTVNAMLLAAAGLPVGLMGIPFLSFFVPPSSGGTGGGIVAKDALGTEVKQSTWLKTHSAGDHSLVQGIKGDPYYLIVKEDNSIETFGLNAVCTHLGCVVPWNAAENKFKCPCHGSQYNNQGKVIRGPAPLSLALAHVDTSNDVVILNQWTETDFRTDLEPWWS